jgi:hypothetical protein
MSITIADLVGTALASGLSASLVLFLVQKYFDRHLDHFFNARLEEIKAGLHLQGEIKNQIASQRLEIYPSLAGLVYRLRNSLREMNESAPLTLDGALAFLRLAEGYTEQIYSARFYLELDRLFEPLHEYKNHVIAAKHLLLDWIHLAQDPSPRNKEELNRVLTRLQEVYVCLDDHHRELIQSLTRLTPA